MSVERRHYDANKQPSDLGRSPSYQDASGETRWLLVTPEGPSIAALVFLHSYRIDSS